MRLLSLLLTASLSSTLLLSACTPKPPSDQTREALVEQESEALNAWFAQRYEEEMARTPMGQSYYGLKTAQDQLDDVSQLALDESAALQQAWLAEMRGQFDQDRLDTQTLLSYRLFAWMSEDRLAAHAFSDHDYVFQHMSGPHTALPSFLINYHTVKSTEDLEAYILRLKAAPTFIGQYTDRANAQHEAGISLPDFVYPKLISSAKNVITGAPFTQGKPSPLWADIQGKIDGLTLDVERKNMLNKEAETALIEHVKPAYEDLIAMFKRHESTATSDDGAWKLPKGGDYYAARLKHYTTTNMSADEIHEIGLTEVARIQDEMRVIMKQVGFDGSLQDFFTYLRTDQKFTYPNTDAGRREYMAEATKVIDEMKGQLNDLFITKPKADVIVKRVEPFREDTAFGAFYNSPAIDGSRPGTYYINLKDMGELPIYQIQSLAYHEGIPGHHMQLAIAQELQDLPQFRTMGSSTAYVEGWALYAETVPKELGLYTDPYQDFGRLSMEIFRAARLVLDTGIHHKKWTRQQAVAYMMENTANSEGDIRAEIDRYIVWPGQATAYMVGLLQIKALRKSAEDSLGDKFDIREFHDVILANGAVPLAVLEELVNDWVEGKL